MIRSFIAQVIQAIWIELEPYRRWWDDNRPVRNKRLKESEDNADWTQIELNVVRNHLRMEQKARRVLVKENEALIELGSDRVPWTVPFSPAFFAEAYEEPSRENRLTYCTLELPAFRLQFILYDMERAMIPGVVKAMKKMYAKKIATEYAEHVHTSARRALGLVD